MKRVALIAIACYRRTLSPLLAGLGAGCRFHPSCSAYAQEAFERHGSGRALRLVLRRLVRCGPWHPGGVDPVPNK